MQTGLQYSAHARKPRDVLFHSVPPPTALHTCESEYTRVCVIPVTLAADGLDLVKLLVQVPQPRHRALRYEKHSGLRVSLLQKNLSRRGSRREQSKHVARRRWWAMRRDVNIVCTVFFFGGIDISVVQSYLGPLL